MYTVVYGPTPKSEIEVAWFSDRGKAEKYAAIATETTPYVHRVKER
jgi:hypothetical protein